MNAHTIISAMDTLLITGHKELYQKARDYVLANLSVTDLNQNSIDDLYAALVSVYTLAHDKEILKKAADFADQYQTPCK